ncbi:tryptophan--tRNA ligase [Neolewinella lacunae]|uniref:Tryptophan--tRNA ligase n=1 Tax=Neolewinella lacunae TaxID=1517758 RepID=A0A923T6L5_9BACT|nr:tryptophan--tRNA ligase [Neolewinella lacunae]MBC6992619.1 tryptophan--tRNA ligase [Neolewinella lacunae]MDN3634360.1 tryptophan--tRNA ligase [Neolewinella lacunae]
MSQNKTILSGIQPTGKLHFGRYFGAVENWKRLQEEYDCLYMVVNYHAMTMPFTAKALAENSWELCFNLLACGIKAENIFIQSLVPEHVELNWILNCFTGYGMLSRMTQFKDKSQQNEESGSEGFISAGLFTYPVLQAADILIYRAHYVPVGKDQEQHLELTRNIAQRFNNFAGREFFPTPEGLYTKVPKVMSTADPTRKMSASLGDKHNIDVFADDNRIRKQVRSAVTDAGGADAGAMSAGVSNLFSLLDASGNAEAHASLLADYEAGALQYADLKEAVADSLIAISREIRENLAELKKDRKAVKDQIKQSSADIRKRAQETLREAKDICGLMNVRF